MCIVCIIVGWLGFKCFVVMELLAYEKLFILFGKVFWEAVFETVFANTSTFFDAETFSGYGSSALIGPTDLFVDSSALFSTLTCGGDGLFN